ncbi:MAG: response regulator transcription factor [Smithella sp.]|jgi:DNA-binding NarL/FixJ family response regulator
MKMIKLAVVTRDEKYLKQLTNRLHREKDISLLSTIIIKNLESEVKQAIAFAEQMVEQQPDILLLDQIILLEVASLDLERTLDYRNKLSTIKTIIVGKRYNEENVMAMMQAGAQGFFRTELGEEQLIKCIRVVDRGEIWLDAEMTTRVLKECIKEFTKKKDLLASLIHLSSAKLDMLSSREMEVLELISKSMTNEEIAEKLFISPKTVKTHLRNIFVKARIRNRVEAALLYTRHALMSH